ncbi:MAG: serine O-acetyltransferase [Rhodocyclaceae bacterium]|jgi:serine O-acetyltransferase|nr:serine O-acetyltransferase [Rhodocyclaceae bacterium]
MSKTMAMTAGTTPAPPASAILAMLREDVCCIFARDPAARSTWEVLTTYPGLHALIIHRLAHALWRGGWRYTGRLLAFVARMFTNIDIHPAATIGRRFFIDHGAGVVIGETAEIGDDVTLYHGVTLGGTTWNGKHHPTLGDGVVVGAGARILGAIVIGAGARIGANSVVVKDVPPGCTAVGIPAHPVGEGTTLRNGSEFILDHHQIPDPVGKAIGCLIDRIDTLERELRALRGEGASYADGRCAVCAAGDLCYEHPRKEAP